MVKKIIGLTLYLLANSVNASEDNNLDLTNKMSDVIAIAEIASMCMTVVMLDQFAEKHDQTSTLSAQFITHLAGEAGYTLSEFRDNCVSAMEKNQKNKQR